MQEKRNWYKVKDTSGISSPALLLYPERIEENIRTMLSMSGSVTALRPHIKTHKMAEVIQMQQRHGIQKFKCATIAEAELLGQCQAKDVLLAMQPVATNIDRFLKLMHTYPETEFSTLVDNPDTLNEIAVKAAEAQQIIALYIDINNGMNRTGCIPDEKALDLFASIEQNEHTKARGLHAYDGHIRKSAVSEQKEACDKAFELVLQLKRTIENYGFHVESIIAGGSPSFPVHSQRTHVESSPGTTLLWDARYAELFPDMAFRYAAVLLIRIISKPAQDILCFDLGHKSVAPEMGFPRVRILGLEDSEQIGQSEEHLVIKTNRAEEFRVGDVFYAIPMHVCPTVSKYAEALTIVDGEVTGAWKVAAQNRKITV